MINTKNKKESLIILVNTAHNITIRELHKWWPFLIIYTYLQHVLKHKAVNTWKKLFAGW